MISDPQIIQLRRIDWRNQIGLAYYDNCVQSNHSSFYSHTAQFIHVLQYDSNTLPSILFPGEITTRKKFLSIDETRRRNAAQAGRFAAMTQPGRE